MLFLAVFCGFLAEYQLEHKIEKDREKQYLRNLLDDLHEDTAILESNMEDLDKHLRRNDSLVRLLTGTELKQSGADLYYLARHASRGPRLALHDPTIQQMRNAGGMRLIRKSKVARGIIEYYNRLVFIGHLQDIATAEADEYRKMATGIFDPLVFHLMVMEDNKIFRPAGNPLLQTYDRPTLLRLAGMVAYISNTKLALKNAEEEMKIAAGELIELIRNEYRLK